MKEQFEIYLIISQSGNINYNTDENMSINMPFVPRVGDKILLSRDEEEAWEDFLIEHDVLRYFCCFDSNLMDFFKAEEQKYFKKEISLDKFSENVKNYIKQEDAHRDEFRVTEFLNVEEVNYTHPDQCIYVVLNRG
jgi:hypothetical protein